MHHLLALLSIGAAIAAPALHAKEFWEQPWTEVRSPHFIVVSAISQSETMDLVDDFENFRAAVQIITNVHESAERVPTRIYVFNRRDSTFIDGYAGGFMERLRANYAVAVADANLALATATIKHQYLHVLLHNRDANDYPRWFVEGFATK